MTDDMKAPGSDPAPSPDEKPETANEYTCPECGGILEGAGTRYDESSEGMVHRYKCLSCGEMFE